MSVCDAIAPPSKAAARKQRIKDVARRLFVENGFHATGIALIAKESGVLVGQLYRDFPSKDDIITAIVQADCDSFANIAALNAAIDSHDRDAIRSWIMNTVGKGDGASDRMFLEIIAEASRNERIAAIFREVNAMMTCNMRRALAALVGDGENGECSAVLADAFMIVSLGSVYARAVLGDAKVEAGRMLIACILDRAAAC